jgi:1,4-alpha-glucan branching enzyme
MAKQTVPSTAPAARTKSPALQKAEAEPKSVKRRKVAFTIQVPNAHEAAIAGSFNDWQPQPLKAAKSPGSFSLTVLLPPGDYEYRFVIDGQWCNDATCPETVPNPFGESNSLLRVA